MRVQIKKWGSTAAIEIPAAIMTAASINIGQNINVRAERGRIIIEPTGTPVYSLEQLLAETDPATFPEEVDFGPPVGKEIW